MMNSTGQNTHKRKGFTLVELLVVIAIIGLLAGFLMPAIGNALDQAKIADEKTRMSQIATAVANFKGQYGYYPTMLTETPQSLNDAALGEDFYQCMTGEAATGGNRKLMNFMSFNDKMVTRGGGGNFDAFTQPLGGSNGDIFIAVDADGDGMIDVNGYDDGNGNSEVYESVILYSLAEGGDGGFTHPTSILTWE